MKTRKGTVLTIFTRTACLFLMGAVMSGVAWAHTLTVTASASCVNGVPVISYTAVSWCTGGTGSGCNNAEIDILFDGVKVDAQPFSFTTTPPDQFSGQKPAPSATTTVIVEGVAVDAWGRWRPGWSNQQRDCYYPHQL
jgi:hypothetical protein